MKCPALYCCVVFVLIAINACNPYWKHHGGGQTLPEVYLFHSPVPGTSPDTDVKAPEASKRVVSRRVTFTVPDGWHWVMRGDDFVATKDGVFLQNMTIERLHVDQVEQWDGEFLAPAFSSPFSSRQWPVRTVKYLKKRFVPGMSPLEAADVVLASRANTPNVSEFVVREVVLQTVAGHPGFRAVYDFRLNVQGRKTPYRTVCYGFMLDDWFYGISYAAAKRHYFQKDAEAFDAVLRSFRVVERWSPAPREITSPG